MNTNATWTTPTYEVPSLREKIKHLLSHHTAAEVYGTLMEVFQEDFAFYRTLFNQPQPAAHQTQPAPPQTQPQPQTQQPPLTKTRGDIRIRVVKRPEAEAEAETEAQTIEKAIEIQPQPLNVDTLPDVSDQGDEEAPPVNEKERKARIKKEQAAAERKKLEELKAQGIAPESLLTKENLNTWVNTQGLSFTQIAREYVGLDAEKISEVAKKFGLQSNIAKKRAQIIAAKRGKN
jgi:hypothetical protein